MLHCTLLLALLCVRFDAKAELAKQQEAERAKEEALQALVDFGANSLADMIAELDSEREAITGSTAPKGAAGLTC